MTLTFQNLLITHVHTEASMGGAGAKVTEVMGNGCAIRIGFYRTGSLRKGYATQGQERRARQDEASSQLSTDSSSAPLRTHHPFANR